MTPLKSTSSSFYDGSKVPRKEPQAIRGRTLIVTPPGSVFSAPRGKGPVGDRCRVGEHGHNMDTARAIRRCLVGHRSRASPGLHPRM